MHNSRDSVHSTLHQRTVDAPARELRITETDTIETLFVTRFPRWKRAIDVFGSLIGMLIVSPLFIAIGILIQIVSPGPIFFKQGRVGAGGKIFTCLKFRTMHLDADSTIHQQHLEKLLDSGREDSELGDPMEKISHDPRIIKGGKLLRASGLDELPQLINVFVGQMSLVGPRPPIPYEVDQYPNWYRARFDIIPGITGLWQISGKNKLGFNEMIRLDIQYTQKRSFLLDCKILFLTPYAVFQQVKDLRQDRSYAVQTKIERGGNSW